MRSTFNLKELQNSGISINEIRTLAENQIILEKELEKPVISKQKYLLSNFKKENKQNKKAENYYKKINKLKSKLAKLYGVTL